MAPRTAASISASANTMFGDLPPSSSDRRLRVPAGSRMISLATSVGPGKAVFLRAAGAGDDVEDALRQPRLLAQLGELERGQRRLRGRLQHHGVAGGQRGGDL